MDEVKAEVEKVLKDIFVGKKQSLEYGTSFDEIPYAILVTKVLWYKVWIISNVRVNSVSRCADEGNINTKIVTRMPEFFTESAAKEYVKKCKEELSVGLNHSLFDPRELMSSLRSEYVSTTELPEEAVKNPNNHIRPGDLLLCTFAVAFSHAGIYIGDGKVVHVSGHGEGKGGSVARIGDLSSDFVGTEKKLWRMDFLLRFRSPDRIVETAKKYAEKGFREAEYHLLTQNCQHFATLCAFGIEYSPDATEDNIIWNRISSTLPFSQRRKNPLSKVLNTFQKIIQ